MRPAVDPTTDRVYESLGDGLSLDDERLGWPLLRFIDSLVQKVSGVGTLGSVDDLVRDSDAGVGWSQVFDVDTVQTIHIPFLGQLVGVSIPRGESAATARQRVRDRETWNRGTPAALEKAAQLTLTGSKKVYLQERSPTPYSLAVQTLVSETPDPAATERALMRAKPAGLVLTYTTVVGTPIDALVGTIDAQPSTIDSL